MFCCLSVNFLSYILTSTSIISIYFRVLVKMSMDYEITRWLVEFLRMFISVSVFSLMYQHLLSASSEASHLSTVCSAAADINGCITIWRAVKYKLFTTALNVCACLSMCVFVLERLCRHSDPHAGSIQAACQWYQRFRTRRNTHQTPTMSPACLRRQASHSLFL